MNPVPSQLGGRRTRWLLGAIERFAFLILVVSFPCLTGCQDEATRIRLRIRSSLEAPQVLDAVNVEAFPLGARAARHPGSRQQETASVGPRPNRTPLPILFDLLPLDDDVGGEIGIRVWGSPPAAGSDCTDLTDVTLIESFTGGRTRDVEVTIACCGGCTDGESCNQGGQCVPRSPPEVDAGALDAAVTDAAIADAAVTDGGMLDGAPVGSWGSICDDDSGGAWIHCSDFEGTRSEQLSRAAGNGTVTTVPEASATANHFLRATAAFGERAARVRDDVAVTGISVLTVHMHVRVPISVPYEIGILYLGPSYEPFGDIPGFWIANTGGSWTIFADDGIGGAVAPVSFVAAGRPLDWTCVEWKVRTSGRMTLRIGDDEEVNGTGPEVLGRWPAVDLAVGLTWTEMGTPPANATVEIDDVVLATDGAPVCGP